MHEKDLMRRELAKQTALLFVVFAVLFALLGLGIYSMVSAKRLPHGRTTTSFFPRPGRRRHGACDTVPV